MTLNDLKEMDLTLYHTLDKITYSTITYEPIATKNYVFFQQEFGAYKTTLTEKQIKTLASFAAVKIQDNERIRLKFYKEVKEIFLRPELCVDLILMFIKYNAKRFEINMEKMKKNSSEDFSILSMLKGLFKKKTNKLKEKIDDEVYDIIKKINPKTSTDTLFVVYETIYNKYQQL